MGATAQEVKVTGSMLEMLLSYDPETGIFTRKITTNPNSVAGEEVSFENDDGYIIVTVGGARLRAHRLAWVWMTGRWPDQDIDHENRDRSDNKFLNLREATRSQNLQNARLRDSNKTGHKGVHYCRQRKKFVAQIKVNKKTVCLGRFLLLEEAVAVRVAAEKEHYGEFR